jgi:hypothetical protein
MIEWVIPGRLARSARPGYPGQGGRPVAPAEVEAWLAEAKALGICSILCLLDQDQLEPYRDLPGGLLQAYRRAGMVVGHVPLRDLQTPPIPDGKLPEVWELFAKLPAPLLVHCSAGLDRTGAAVGYILRRLDQQGAERPA